MKDREEYISILEQDNAELKKQVEELSKNYNLDVDGIYIVSRNDEIIRLDKKALEYLRSLEQKNYKLKMQQKEFIKYMNDTIEDLETENVDDEEMKGYLIQRIYTFKEILQKYEEIMNGTEQN